MQNAKACCLQTHMPINLRGNWPMLVMPRPRFRCWTWNHRWTYAQAPSLPTQQIQLITRRGVKLRSKRWHRRSHSDWNQTTLQRLVAVQMFSSTQPPRGPSEPQWQTGLLLGPCPVFGLLGPVLRRILPHQVSETPAMYSRSRSPLPTFAVPAFGQLWREILLKWLGRNPSMFDVSSLWFSSHWLPLSAHWL